MNRFAIKTQCKEWQINYSKLDTQNTKPAEQYVTVPTIFMHCIMLLLQF